MFEGDDGEGDLVLCRQAERMLTAFGIGKSGDAFIAKQALEPLAGAVRVAGKDDAVAMRTRAEKSSTFAKNDRLRARCSVHL